MKIEDFKIKGVIMQRKFRKHIYVGILLGLLVNHVVYADWELQNTPPISPEMLNIVFGQLAPPDGQIMPMGFPLGDPLEEPTPPPPGTFETEIEELARSLKYDPDLIFQFVHDHIEFEPRMGDIKGAYMALMDRSGGPCDQASLMIELLRASGYSSAEYVSGRIRLTFDEASNWLGVPNNHYSITSALNQALIPLDLLEDEDVIDVNHFWVSVNIDGIDYVFDPSFKAHNIRAGIDLEWVMNEIVGYHQTGFKGQVTAGSTSDSENGANYIQNLNTANLQDKLELYSDAIIGYLRTEHQSASLDDILGGREIVPFSGNYRQTDLPYRTPNSSKTFFTSIPDNHKYSLEITLPGNNRIQLPSSEIYGRRLTITYNDNLQPVLRLEGGDPLMTGEAASYSGFPQILQFTMYIFEEEKFSNIKTISAGGTYSVLNGWGKIGQQIISKRRDNLRRYLDEGLNNNTEAVLGETLFIQALSWLAQDCFYQNIVSKVSNSYLFSSAVVGISGHSSAPYVDIPIALTGAYSHDQSSDYYAAFLAGGYFSSALEWGIIPQNQPGLDAVSTIRLLDQANLDGIKIYEVNKTNYDNFLKPENHPTYNETTISYLWSSFESLGSNDEQVVLLPENGKLSIIDSVDAWNGYTYLIFKEHENRTATGYIISGGYHGGYGAWENMVYDPVDVSTYVPMNVHDMQTNNHGENPKSYDPIDLFSGAFLYDHGDMKVGVGAYPYSLDFRRSYSSANALNDGPMGRGWSHNYEITARKSSNGFKAMGSDSPVDAAAAIIATYINFDLLKNRTLENVVISAMTTKWMMDQMIDNVVTVSQPGSSMIFTKLPDGSYNPPPGKSGELTLTNDRYHLRDKKGNQIQFNEAGLIEQWSDPAGRTVDFAYDTIVHTNPEDRSKIFYSYVSNQWQEFPFDSDLVSHWKFDNPANLGYDSKGQNHATMPPDSSRRPTYADAGRYNGGLYFDEDHNDYLEVSNPSNMNQESYTLTFWTELVPNHYGYWNYTWHGGYQGLIGKVQTFESYNFTYKIDFRYGEGRGKFRTTDSPTYSCYNSTPSILNEGWCMWALSVGNGIRSFYRNGWLEHQSTYTGSANLQNTYSFLIGSKFSYTSFYGTIDDIRFYKEALDANEVSKLYLDQQETYQEFTEYKLKKVSNNYGQELNFLYTDGDSGPYIASVNDGKGRSVSFTRNANDELTEYTDPEGNTTVYVYDPERKAHMTRIFYPTFPDNPFVTNVYNRLGQVQTQTNAKGQTYHYYYTGYRSEEINPLGGSMIHYFGKNGLVNAIEDQMGNITRTLYDGQRRKIMDISPEGSSVRYRYDVNHNIIETASTAGPENYDPDSGLESLIEVDSFLYFNGEDDYLDIPASSPSSLNVDISSFSLSCWVKPAFLTGTGDACLHFNGENDRGSWDWEDSFFGSKRFTISAWVKAEQPTLLPTQGSNSGSDVENQYLLYPLTGQVGFTVGTNGVVIYHSSVARAVYSGNIGTDWNYITIAIGAGPRAYCYINGNIVHEVQLSRLLLHYPLFPAHCLGGYTGRGHFKGAVRNLQIWNRELTNQEINESMSDSASNVGLVGQWDFDDGIGNLASDSSGYEQHITLTGGEWYRANASSAPQGLISKRLSSAGYELVLNPSGTITAVVGDGSNVVEIETTQMIEADEWTHIAASFDRAGQCTVYINGTSAGSAAIDVCNGSVSNESSLHLGRLSSGTSYFQGSLSNVSIWNTVRSEQDINDEIEFGLSGAESGLVGYWKLDESAGTTVNDSAVNSDNHGTSSRNLNLLRTTEASDLCYVERFTYEDTYNNILSHTDNAGNVTRYYYENPVFPSYVSKVEHPEIDGTIPTTLFEYYSVQANIGSYGRIKTTQEVVRDIFTENIYEDIITEFFYNESGQNSIGALRKTVVDTTGLQITSETTYDQFGNITSVTDTKGNTTTFDEYDNNRNLKQRTSAVGYETRYDYDELGRLVKTHVQTDHRDHPWLTTETVYTLSGEVWKNLIPNDVGACSLEFDGEGSRVDLSYGATTLPTNSFTISAWVKPTGQINNEGVTESNSGTAGRTGQKYLFWPTYYTGTKAGMGVSVGTDGISVYEHGYNYMPPLAVYTGNIGLDWSHIAIVYENKQPKIYLNGILVHTGLVSAKTTVEAPVNIGGGHYSNYSGYLEGSVRSVQLWSRALTAQEVEDNLSGVVSETGLMGNWGLDEGCGTVVHDSSSNGHQGAIIGAIWSSDVLVTEYIYDELDRVKEVIDANGNRTNTEYYPNGRVWKQIDAEENVEVEYTYTPNGNVQSIKDANGNITQYAYDGFGRLTHTLYEDNTFEVLTYDDLGRLSKKTTRSDQDILFGYDAIGRLNTKQTPEDTIVYAYDILGRTDTVTNSLGVIDYEYDSLGRLTHETTPGHKTVSYEYDLAGNVAKLIYPDGSFVTYDYDELNRLRSITDQERINVVTYQYDALSRRKHAYLGNGTITSYEYDLIGRLRAINNQTANRTHRFAYTYDSIGNRLSMTVNGDQLHRYGYDNKYQLISVDYPSPYFVANIEYNYDAVGNRENDSLGTIYQPNNLNQYETVDGIMLTYDQNGNLTSDPETSATYIYDSENRLLYAITQTQSTGYTYDALGRRFAKNVDGAVTYYVYSGVQVIGEYDGADFDQDTATRIFVYGAGIDEPVRMTVLPRRDISGDGIAGSMQDFNIMIATWLLRAGDTGFDERADLNHDGVVDNVDADILASNWMAAVQQSRRYYFHADGLGSVVALSDRDGRTVEVYRYDVFGRTAIYDLSGQTAFYDDWVDLRLRPASVVGNPYFFTGRRLDFETGLYYYRARMYSPNLGRFLQTDPVGYADGINWYAYCGNNPVAFLDPWGLCKSGSLNWDTMNAWDYIKLFGGGFLQGAATPFVDLATMPGDYYGIFRDSGMGPIGSGLQSANMTAGKILGYGTLAEGLMGVDARSMRLTSGWERAGQVGLGGAQTALSVVAATSAVSSFTGSATPRPVTINGRTPINSRYAGQTHPSGVKFNKRGFPDFSSHAKVEVKVPGLTGSYAKDAAMANKTVGFSNTPAGYTWHHVEDAVTMQLVPSNLHGAVGHTGGVALIRSR